jgi:F420-non-reducing hydrogenase large subunit
MAKQIVVSPATRIEGHARILLDLDDAGAVASARLEVLDIRGFEKLLERMELLKMPLITARLCGVCPAAHHLAAVVAIENGLGVTPPDSAKRMRELLYMGHILHSHALSAFVLSGPDVLLGLDAAPAQRNIFHLLKVDTELAKKLLRLRTIGQKAVEEIGGRGVHPVSLVPGGIAFRPSEAALKALAASGQEAVTIVAELLAHMRQRLALLKDVREAARLPLSALSLSNHGTLSFLDGDWVVRGPQGAIEKRFQGAAYGEHVTEHVMPGSYMKAVHLRGVSEPRFFVGPLARVLINDKMDAPKAQVELTQLRSQLAAGVSAVDFIEARLVEMLYAAERIALLAQQGPPTGPLAVDVTVKAGRYVGAIEAPRGLLVHDYTADAQGHVTAANLIVATQNNYDAINSAIAAVAGALLPKKDDNLLMNGMEFALRCFDPCLACATHAAGQLPLSVELRQPNRETRVVVRGGQR